MPLLLCEADAVSPICPHTSCQCREAKGMQRIAPFLVEPGCPEIHIHSGVWGALMLIGSAQMVDGLAGSVRANREVDSCPDSGLFVF